MELWCSKCLRIKFEKDGRYHGTEGINRAVHEVAGLSMCSEHADELLAKILKEPEKASTQELEQAFVLTSAKARPELDAEGAEW